MRSINFNHVGILLLVLALLHTRSAWPVTITVDSLGDDATPATGCQLRQAIESANTDSAVSGCDAGSGNDKIEFSVNGTIQLQSDLPAITEGLTVSGPGMSSLYIDGDGLYRQFEFSFGAEDYVVENLSMIDGNASFGGCISHQAERLKLSNVHVEGCIASTGGALYITTSIISGGRTTVIENSTFLDNESSGSGGAIFFGNFSGNGSNLTINDSTFQNNRATGSTSNGGAISVGADSTDTVTVERSTFQGNTSDNAGSVLYVYRGAEITIKHSTISGNTADADANGSGNGAISLQSSSLVLENSIIAGNLDLSSITTQPDISISVAISITSNGYNWIGDNSGATSDFPAGTPNANDDNVGSSSAPLDAMLQTIGDYGGNTLTMPPMFDSPVIDQGSCAGERVDQRGVGNSVTTMRPIDLLPANVADGCDPGAVERRPSYTVGGTVSGLSGSGLVLQINGGDDEAIAADGAFTFDTPLTDGSAYAVTVKTQPSSPAQTCVVGNGSGTLSGANVTKVSITCSTETYTIGGSVSGLSGSGLVLQNNGGDDEAIGSDGVFTFDTPLADGSDYAVTVKTQPASPEQICSVTNGTGTISGANVSDALITCAAPSCDYAITQPDGGESWVAGQDYAINWSKVGNDCAATANLELYDGGVLAQTIVSGTSDTSYNWSIPSDQAIGFDYTVKVVDSVTASYSAESAGPFVINSPFCNTQIAPMVTEFGVAAYEACDTLIVPPGFTGASGSEVRLSSGRDVVVEPGASFELGGLLETAVCGQSLCETSAEPMPEGCHSCVEAVCLADSSCCTLEWDQACVDLVATECSLTCE